MELRNASVKEIVDATMDISMEDTKELSKRPIPIGVIKEQSCTFYDAVNVFERIKQFISNCFYIDEMLMPMEIKFCVSLKDSVTSQEVNLAISNIIASFFPTQCFFIHLEVVYGFNHSIEQDARINTWCAKVKERVPNNPQMDSSDKTIIEFNYWLPR